MFDIKKTRTTPYHPQSDGLVERLNKTLVDTITLIAKDAQDTWYLRIGLALIPIRSAAQSTAGYSPHFLLFGREIRLPADLYYDLPPKEPASAAESVANLRQVVAEVHQTVTANMESSQKRQNIATIEKRTVADFTLGTWCG